MSEPRSIFSAAEPGLGFIYQPRLALLRILSLPESTSLLIEKSDDLEFDMASGRKVLASLKHKADGDKLTDLDVDFWKSVRVWLAFYIDNGRINSNADFVLFTTSVIAPGSELALFGEADTDPTDRASTAATLLERSTSATIGKTRTDLA